MKDEEKEAFMAYLKNTAEAMAATQNQLFINLYKVWLKHKEKFTDFTAFLADFDSKLEIYIKRFQANEGIEQ